MTTQETIDRAAKIALDGDGTVIVGRQAAQALADAGLLADGATTADLTIHLMKRHEVEAERDAALAKLDQVRAAMHEWAGSHHSGYYDEAQDDAWRVVAPILDGEAQS